jgi:hypothetical protein
LGLVQETLERFEENTFVSETMAWFGEIEEMVAHLLALE